MENQRLAVLIGDPGSGKSALINQLTWSLLVPDQQQALPETLQDRIPLRIILRRVEIPAGAQARPSWLGFGMRWKKKSGRHWKPVSKQASKQRLYWNRLKQQTDAAARRFNTAGWPG